MALTRAVLDTSVFLAQESGRGVDELALPDRAAVSMITVGELRAGVLAAADLDVRQRRLATLSEALAFEPVPVDDHVAAAWARLRVALREVGRRMPVNDSWIAATALALGIPVVTQDADFDGVPSLDVTKA